MNSDGNVSLQFLKTWGGAARRICKNRKDPKNIVMKIKPLLILPVCFHVQLSVRISKNQEEHNWEEQITTREHHSTRVAWGVFRKAYHIHNHPLEEEKDNREGEGNKESARDREIERYRVAKNRRIPTGHFLKGVAIYRAGLRNISLKNGILTLVCNFLQITDHFFFLFFRMI